MRVKLSEDLKYWRADRPSEWLMDEFIRAAQKLEDELERKQLGAERTLDKSEGVG